MMQERKTSQGTETRTGQASDEQQASRPIGYSHNGSRAQRQIECSGRSEHSVRATTILTAHTPADLLSDDGSRPGDESRRRTQPVRLLVSAAAVPGSSTSMHIRRLGIGVERHGLCTMTRRRSSAEIASPLRCTGSIGRKASRATSKLVVEAAGAVEQVFRTRDSACPSIAVPVHVVMLSARSLTNLCAAGRSRRWCTSATMTRQVGTFGRGSGRCKAFPRLTTARYRCRDDRLSPTRARSTSSS